MIITKEGYAVLDKDSHLSRWITITGKIEHTDQAVVAALRLINEGDWVIDVGASFGDHTIPYAKKVGETGAVFAFEPQPESLECLRYNTTGYPQVRLFNFAVGEINGTGYLDRAPNVGASALFPLSGGPVDKTGFTKVEVKRIDNMKFKRMDFIKIDAEGYDLFALRGAVMTILKHRPVIMCELNGRMWKYFGIRGHHIETFLEEINYRTDTEVILDERTQLDVILTPN